MPDPSMSGPSQRQQQAFVGSVERLGLTTEQVADAVTIQADTSPVSTAHDSPLALHQITLHSADELRAMLSTADAQDLAAHDVGPAPAADAVDPTSVRRAVLAQVFGQTEPVTAAIADQMFPLPAVVTAARDVTVAAGHELVLSSDGHAPLLASFQTLTLEAGARITCDVSVHLTVQIFVKDDQPA